MVPSTSRESKLNVDAPPYSAKNNTSLCVAANRTVLLQTAITTVLNPDKPNISKTVQLVLDLNSQRLHITQQAALSLQRSSIGIQQMSIITLVSSQATSTNCELVSMLMKTLHGEMELCLLATPIICEPLNTRPLTLCTSSCEHISDLVYWQIFFVKTIHRSRHTTGC